MDYWSSEGSLAIKVRLLIKPDANIIAIEIKQGAISKVIAHIHDQLKKIAPIIQMRAVNPANKLNR
ncbi:MAG: hypothetical protein COA78_15375 [Blastopirellula sp.]|nr:MAG: hypothetical protein COA78_15375 [Blastopirellula sp.]